jgi:hypothetical protein
MPSEEVIKTAELLVAIANIGVDVRLVYAYRPYVLADALVLVMFIDLIKACFPVGTV